MAARAKLGYKDVPVTLPSCVTTAACTTACQIVREDVTYATVLSSVDVPMHRKVLCGGKIPGLWVSCCMQVLEIAAQAT